MLDLLATAGPFTDFAAPRRIFVIRTNDERVARIPFNYDKVSGEQENFYLMNGDIVLVP